METIIPLNNYETVNQTIKQLDDYETTIYTLQDFNLKLHLKWGIMNLRKLMEKHRKELSNENTTGI